MTQNHLKSNQNQSLFDVSSMNEAVLIAVKRNFDVSEVSTKNQSLLEHECLKIKCDRFFLNIIEVYLARLRLICARH
jgi:hypothetical protein